MDRLGDRQSEHRNDRWIGYLADEPRPERSEYGNSTVNWERMNLKKRSRGVAGTCRDVA